MAERCGNCGALVAADDLHCENCGQPLQPRSFFERALGRFPKTFVIRSFPHAVSLLVRGMVAFLAVAVVCSGSTWLFFRREVEVPAPFEVTRVVQKLVTPTPTTGPTNTPGPSPTPTPVPTMTPTPKPTSTPIIIPTATPEPVAYQLVFLSRIGNWNLGQYLADIRRGDRGSVDGIPFELSEGLYTQDEYMGSNPTVGVLPITIEHPKRVFVLLNAAWALTDYEHQAIGYIELLFDNDERVSVDPVLGENIRSANTALSGTREVVNLTGPDAHRGLQNGKIRSDQEPMGQSRDDLALTLAAQEREDEIVKWVPERKLPKPEQVKDPKDGKTYPVSPDAYFIYQQGETGKRAHFFLEMDMGSMTNPNFAKKIKAYILYWETDAYVERYQTYSLKVLTVTTGKVRARNLKRTTEEAGGKSMFWFTSWEQLESEDVLESVWHIAGQPEPASLLGGPTRG